MDGKLGARRVAGAGVGARESVTADSLRTAAAAVAHETKAYADRIAWVIDDSLPLPPAEQARAIVDGTLLGGYEPARWKGEDPASKLSTLVICSEADGVKEAAERAATIAAWANRARDLVNSPPNELTPERLAERARELASGAANLTAEALGPDEIGELGMGALAAVAQGSDNPARLVVLRYDPPGAKGDVFLGLVGKAITFDTGGISLKPSLHMEDMKGDMAGGAAVIEATGAIAELGIPLRVITVAAASENMPSGHAYRPGDIIRAANGKTIEITNTDAEGRLVLADALWYARREGATHVLDLATLTGAMEVALGDLYAGVFGNDDSLARPGRRGRRGERRPRVAVPDEPALPPLRRLGLRRPEELVGPAPGGRGARRRVPGGVRRRGPLGARGHRRPGVPRALARRLPAPARRHRLRRSPDRRAGHSPVGLNFDLTPEHELVRRTVREFAEQKVAPVAAELDREHRFPYDLVAELAELGLMGMPVPEEYGGAGADTLSYAIAVEELTRIDSSVAITLAAHTSLGTMPILLFGTEEQKQQWLPDLASGKKLAAFGLTEPGAGSDAAAARTTAELRDGQWVINGSKIFITNAGTDITSCVTITARTGEDEISNLIVANGTAGYEISAPMDKLGWRASDTRELSFKDCAVPEENLLGERGQGFRQFLEILDGGRISVAAMGVGLAQGAYDLAVRLREGARAVRQADRAVPGGAVRAGRHGRRDRGGPRAHLQSGVAQGRGPAVREGGGDGEALHGRAIAPRRERRPADPRRLRVHGGVRDRAALPRPEDPRDRRGH